MLSWTHSSSINSVLLHKSNYRKDWYYIIPINRHQVTLLSRQQNSKQNPGRSDPALYPIFAHAQINAEDMLKEFTVYEMAHWTNYIDRWMSGRNSPPNTTGYKRGSILFIDLGAENFGHEPSFTHPGVVLDQTKDSILIAPCSSKKYGKGYPEIVNATISDGFSTNTGIQVNCIRWISKSRVISKAGFTTSAILDQIDANILKSIPLHTKILINKDTAISKLMLENQKLSQELAYLKSISLPALASPEKNPWLYMPFMLPFSHGKT